MNTLDCRVVGAIRNNIGIIDSANESVPLDLRAMLAAPFTF